MEKQQPTQVITNYFEVLTDVNGKQFLIKKPCPYGLQVLGAAISNSHYEEERNGTNI